MPILPKISVLMPIYNTDKKYLKESIESILNQSYTDFEFLILNDSPENNELDELVNSFDDPRIIYHKNDSNIGISASRNRLISLSKGEYLAVMDHDDISLPERFEKQVEVLDKELEIGVVSNYVNALSGKRFHYPQNDEDIKMALSSYCAIIHPCAMIRKSVLEENNICYEEEFSPAEDYRLWCKLIDFTKFHNINEVLFLYRDHTLNTTNIQAKKMYDVTLAVQNEVRQKHYMLYYKYISNNPKVAKERKPFFPRPKKKYQIRLFSFIPFIYIKKDKQKVTFYLFGFIPFISLRAS